MGGHDGEEVVFPESRISLGLSATKPAYMEFLVARSLCRD